MHYIAPCLSLGKPGIPTTSNILNFFNQPSNAPPPPVFSERNIGNLWEHVDICAFAVFCHPIIHFGGECLLLKFGNITGWKIALFENFSEKADQQKRGELKHCSVRWAPLGKYVAIKHCWYTTQLLYIICSFCMWKYKSALLSVLPINRAFETPYC